MALNRQVTVAELEDFLKANREHALGGRPVLITVLHHTWQPTAAAYRGLSTWQSIERYHTGVRGWRDIGYHIGVAPDKTIWLLRPISMTGAHSLGRYQGRRVNDCSIGVAMIGNFDVEDPELCLPTALRVLAVIHRVFGLPASRLHFHREFQNKTCPGTKISLAGTRKCLAAILAGEADEPPYHKPDVSDWAKPYVEQAKELGVLGGYPDGSFRGNQPLTREEAAVALVRLYEKLRGGEQDAH